MTAALKPAKQTKTPWLDYRGDDYSLSNKIGHPADRAAWIKERPFAVVWSVASGTHGSYGRKSVQRHFRTEAEAVAAAQRPMVGFGVTVRKITLDAKVPAERIYQRKVGAA